MRELLSSEETQSGELCVRVFLFSCLFVCFDVLAGVLHNMGLPRVGRLSICRRDDL